MKWCKRTMHTYETKPCSVRSSNDIGRPTTILFKHFNISLCFWWRKLSVDTKDHSPVTRPGHGPDISESFRAGCNESKYFTENKCFFNH